MVNKIIKNNQKGGKKKMEVLQITREGFIEVCPYCNKKLKPANSKKTATANLKQHLIFCEKNLSNQIENE